MCHFTEVSRKETRLLLQPLLYQLSRTSYTAYSLDSPSFISLSLNESYRDKVFKAEYVNSVAFIFRIYNENLGKFKETHCILLHSLFNLKSSQQGKIG